MRQTHEATWHVSRSVGSHGDDRFRLEIRFDDTDRGKLTIDMDARQFAEGVTARVTRVQVEEFRRDQ